jgi:hypothetical protein
MLRRVRVTIVAVEKQVCVFVCFCVCVCVRACVCVCVCVALVTEHAMRMRHIILSPVACPALPYFSTLSNKGHGFQKSTEQKCVFRLSLQLLSETFHSEENSVKYYHKRTQIFT